MMRDTEIAVRFQPSGKVVYVLPGTRLAEAAAMAGLVLDVPCGGEGICGKCKVRVQEAPARQPPPIPACWRRRSWPRDTAWLARRRSPTRSRWKCRKVPLPAAYHKILTETEDVARKSSNRRSASNTSSCRRPAATTTRRTSKRLQRAVGRFEVDLELARRLPGLLRAAEFRGTAVLADQASGGAAGCWTSSPATRTRGPSPWPSTWERPPWRPRYLSLTTGQTLDVTTRLNPQTRFGDDVLSRILHCQQPGGLADLRQAIAEAIDGLIEQLVSQTGVDRREIYEIACSGNTTMQQLLAGIDSRNLGEVPFVPAIGAGLTVPAAELGFSIHPRGLAYLLPVIGGFVGGDTVAGVLATGLCDAAAPSLLVDIGTNGEIVLSAGGKLTAASTAAGPAFEGAANLPGHARQHGGHRKGGRRQPSADQRHRRCSAAGNLRLGLDRPGRGAAAPRASQPRRPAAGSGPIALGRPARPGPAPDLARQAAAFLVAAAEEAGHGRPIWLTQRDLRELQLATGAICAGIVVLLKCRIAAGRPARSAGCGRVRQLHSPQQCPRIGLLPHGVPHHRIRYRGNTSLAGCELVALSRRVRRIAEELAGRTRHVDLREPDFATTFAESMIFPEDGAEGT